MPTVVERSKPVEGAQDRPSTFARRLAISILRFAIVLMITAAIGGGWYMARKGFGGRTRSRIVEELHRLGVEASIGHLTLNPFRGLVARNVRIFSYRNRTNTLAFITEIVLDINYAAFFHHQPFLNALDIRNAEVTLPLKGPQGKNEQPQLRKFHAHVYFPPEQIYVSQAEGVFCGVRISATGQLIKRANYQPSSPVSEEEWQKGLAILERIVKELQKFSFPAAPPSLQIKFSGDVAELENARVEATLSGDRLQRGNYEMRGLSATAEWSDQHLNITHCEWNDGSGSFAGRADWSRQGNRVNFQMRSSLDLKIFLDAFDLGGPLADITFYSPPVVEISGSANLGQSLLRPQIIGHAIVASFAYKRVPFSDLAADFSWDGERALLRDVRLGHQTGQLRADLFDGPNDFRLNIDSTISPGAMRAFVPFDLAEFLGEWGWQRSPTIHLAIRGQDHNPENWRGDGTITLDRTRFRGVGMNGGSMKIHFADGAISCQDFHVLRDEGTGAGNFTYDFKRHEVRVSNIKSFLDPAEAIFWIDPKVWQTIVPYKFRHPPTVTANGIYQFRGGKNTHLEITVDGANGMDYDFLGKTLPFDRVAARLLFTDDRLQIVDLRGALLSGTVRGNADISLARNDPHYRANVSVSAIDFPHLTDLYYNYQTAHGQLSGTYDFTGLGSDARTMRGRGKVDVTNGNVKS